MSANTIATALDTMSERLAQQPERARAKGGVAVATLASGLVFDVRGPNGEHVRTDMVPAMGGSGSAPNPGWLLRASMASCTATVIASRAARQGVALTLLEVSVAGESDLRGQLGSEPPVSAGFFGQTMKVRIAGMQATRAELEDIVRWAQAHSPVGCTVCEPTDCELQIDVLDSAR